MPDEMTKQIASDLGISEMKPEEQRALIAQFGEVALKSATIAVLEAMPAEKRDEFATLSEGGDPEALKSFLDGAVPTHESIARQAVQDEVKRFKAFQAA